MLYASDDDIVRCTEIVKKELMKKNVDFNDDILKKITLDIMGISYSKGGDYSDSIIHSYAKIYIEEDFYKKFFD